MGMPLSRFSQLADVLDTRNERQEYNLSGFKVFCIVLHDADNREFEDRIKWEFKSLDVLTGDSMLFMSFFEPPYEWRYETDYMRRSRLNVCGEEISNEDELLDCFKAMLHSDLDFPLIVISTDLNSKDVVLLKSSTDKICRQLKHIGKYAEGLTDYIDISKDKDFRNFISDIGVCRDVRLSKGLSQQLFDIVAANAIINPSNDYFATRHNIDIAVRKGILSRRKRMEHCKMDDDLMNAENEYYSYRKLVMMNASQKRRKSFRMKRRGSMLEVSSCFMEGDELEPEILDFSDIKIDPHTIPDGLLTNSRKALLDYNSYIGFLETPVLNMFEYGLDDGTEINFSHAGQDLYDIMCFEMESSVEQVIRSVSGITMPEFYMRYCENVTCRLSSGRILVDFNMPDKRTSWRPPTLGEAMHTLRKMIEDGRFVGNWDCFNVFSSTNIVNRAIDINGIRNRGIGHSTKLEENDFYEMFRLFMPFWCDYFNDIIAVRKQVLSL